jgi:DNA-binding transcriptional ArsR family regulator
MLGAAARLGVMVWRVHFTAGDLARTRIGAPMGPLAETQLALSQLRCPVRRPAGFGGWRGHVQGLRSAHMRPFEALIPRGSLGVDLFSAAGEAPTIGQGIDALLAIPRHSMLAEMDLVDRQHRLPSSAWAAAEEGSGARLQLASAAETAYQALVEPYWAGISAHLHAERVSRGRILMDGGVERLLATLLPGRIQWRPPVLEVNFRSEADLYLDGRGLVLSPSLFAGDVSIFVMGSGDGAPSLTKLIFPAPLDPAGRARLWNGGQRAASPLAALVGRTRAATLHSIADGCTTTELARRNAISTAAASQHAAVLREAGLIVTRRHGSAVLHSLTALGAELLHADG